jgi:hypothetical protein
MGEGREEERERGGEVMLERKSPPRQNPGSATALGLMYNTRPIQASYRSSFIGWVWQHRPNSVVCRYCARIKAYVKMFWKIREDNC